MVNKFKYRSWVSYLSQVATEFVEFWEISNDLGVVYLSSVLNLCMELKYWLRPSWSWRKLMEALWGFFHLNLNFKFWTICVWFWFNRHNEPDRWNGLVDASGPVSAPQVSGRNFWRRGATCGVTVGRDKFEVRLWAAGYLWDVGWPPTGSIWLRPALDSIASAWGSGNKKRVFHWLSRNDGNTSCGFGGNKWPATTSWSSS